MSQTGLSSHFNWRICSVLIVLLFAIKPNYSVPYRRAGAQRAIVFPQDNFDDCILDDGIYAMQRGECKFIDECPDVLLQWQRDNVYPKTCYFMQSDQYVCCPKVSRNTSVPLTPYPPVEVSSSSSSSRSTDASTSNSLPLIETTTKSFFDLIFEDQRPSEIECELNQIVRTAVVNGIPTEEDEFPFMAALGWTSNAEESVWYRCGGAIISNKFILTAAHCAEIGGTFADVVRVGGSNLTDTSQEDVKIKRFVSHPDYNAATIQNDIALVELEEPLKHFSVACLLLNPDILSTNVTALGYGHIRFGGAASDQLLKAPLKVVAQEDCNDYYRRSGDIGDTSIVESHLCANDPDELRDTCQGDSGGPLIMENAFKRVYVVGITSFGLGCAGVPPSIYTRVSSYIDWIESIAWPKSDKRIL